MKAGKRTRRDFLRRGIYLGAGALAAGPLSRIAFSAAPGSKMKFGLVTYLWGKDWDLPTLISNCEKTNVLGVELRVEHAHDVHAGLSAAERREVKKMFADSPVECVGMGTNYAFHYTDKDRLAREIEGAKKYVKLSYDIGGTGIKVKPNDLPKGVSVDETTQQIGRSLNEIGRYAAQLDQMIRLEVHGGCSRLPIMRKIMDAVTEPNVGACWNCNGQDLQGEGIEYNFNLIKDSFADTVHIRELDSESYPYQKLMDMFVEMDYEGWILLEARGKVADRVQALEDQRRIFERMVAKAQASQRARQTSGVSFIEGDKKVSVQINGDLFTEYHYEDVPRPYFYPVIGPTGEAVIRHWPMSDKNPADAKDHVHHKSLWFTHGEVNGQDFWGEGSKSGRIVTEKVSTQTTGDKGVLVSQSKWVAKDGTVVCTDTRKHTFYGKSKPLMMDFEVTIHASHGKVVMGDTKEGSMAIRLAPSLREDKGGHIINSEGDKDGSAWGKRAKWVDYYGPLNGKTVGVAIFDHPDNPRHPTWWHVRTYGLFAANPFGIHNFERKSKGVGDFEIEAGKSQTWKWRFYFHEGDCKQGDVERMYGAFAGGK